MDYETRMYHRFVDVLATGAFAGISAGALAAWLLGVELPGGALWFYAGGGLLGVLIAAVYGWRTFEDV
ncbi:hypothetical protein ACFWY6_17105 [Streptomyces sp. NPDC059037]|uniref:hypothetical protein n=1 Tax=Streptomyces sp. NPDC059037 TaxID=3346710 RepID=UPI0036A80EDF